MLLINKRVSILNVYVDVSETYYSGIKTGIQRVVKELSRNLLIFSGDIPIKLVISKGSSYYQITPDEFFIENGSVDKKNKFYKRFVIKLIQINKLVFDAFFFFWIKIKYRKNSAMYSEERLLDFSTGDILVMPDSWWGGSDSVISAENAKKNGAKIILFVHDLFPISHPQYCEGFGVTRFKPNLIRMLNISTLVLGVSKFSANETLKFINSNRNLLSNIPSVDYLYLGNDFAENNIGKTLSNAKHWLNGIWQSNHVYLMVGTIDPRKNQHFVFAQFLKKWQMGSLDVLLIIGRPGGKYAETLLDEIKNSGYFNKLCFIEHNASDAMLAYAYNMCRATIIASEIEGFGLPLIEALANGTPVLASDIPVFREIAGDFVRYFELNNPISFDTEFNALNVQYADLKLKSKSFEWLSWQASANFLLEKINDF